MNSVASTNVDAAGEFLLDPRDEAVRHGAAAQPADRAIAAALDLGDGQFGLIVVGIGHAS